MRGTYGWAGVSPDGTPQLEGPTGRNQNSPTIFPRTRQATDDQISGTPYPYPVSRLGHYAAADLNLSLFQERQATTGSLTAKMCISGTFSAIGILRKPRPARSHSERSRYLVTLELVSIKRKP